MKLEYFGEMHQACTTITNKLLILASYKNSKHNMKCKYLPVTRKGPILFDSRATYLEQTGSLSVKYYILFFSV